MLSAEEILDLMKNLPKGYIGPEDDLFTASNLHLLQSYKKLGAISSTEYDNLNDSSSSSLNSSTNEIFCNVFGCSMIFDNISSYQSHYNVMHRFICSECKKSLPTDHLLDLHISESHDSYFTARVERGEHVYKCYLEECNEVFGNISDRKEHCIKLHKFPGNFRFDQISHKNVQPSGKKSTKSRTQKVTMEVVEEPEHIDHKTKKELKMISFGHQKEKTFRPKNGPKQKHDISKTLENMDSLKEVLNSM